MEICFAFVILTFCCFELLLSFKIAKRCKKDIQICNDMIDDVLKKANEYIEEAEVLNKLVQKKEARIQELEEIEKEHKKENKKVLKDLATLEKQYSELLNKNKDFLKEGKVPEKPVAKKTTRKRKEVKK